MTWTEEVRRSQWQAGPVGPEKFHPREAGDREGAGLVPIALVAGLAWGTVWLRNEGRKPRAQQRGQPLAALADWLHSTLKRLSRGPASQPAAVQQAERWKQVRPSAAAGAAAELRLQVGQAVVGRERATSMGAAAVAGRPTAVPLLDNGGCQGRVDGRTCV